MTSCCHRSFCRAGLSRAGRATRMHWAVGSIPHWCRLGAARTGPHSSMLYHSSLEQPTVGFLQRCRLQRCQRRMPRFGQACAWLDQLHAVLEAAPHAAPVLLEQHFSPVPAPALPPPGPHFAALPLLTNSAGLVQPQTSLRRSSARSALSGIRLRFAPSTRWTSGHRPATASDSLGT